MSAPPSVTRTIALCSIANLINAADRIIMPIAIVPMTDEFKWNLHWQGWILSSFAFGYISSQILGSGAARKYGGKRVLTCAVFLWSLSTLLTPVVAPSLVLLILSRTLLGFGEGLGLPTVYHIFANNVPIEERSKAFSYLVSFGTIGQTIASLVCPHFPWPWMFYVFGIMGMLWVILWLIFYKETTEPLVLSMEEETGFFPKVSMTGVQWVAFFKSWPLWSIYIAHFAMNWSNYVIMHWLPTYLSRNLGASNESMSLTAVPYIANVLVGIAAGHCADFLIRHRSTVLSVRRLMTAVGLVGPGVFILFFSGVQHLPLAVILISISMGLCATNSAGHLSNHSEVAPHHSGVTFAISNTLATIPGIVCGPLTAELVTQSHGRWYPVFIIAALINFVGAIIYCSHSSAAPVL
ncbi:PREDICTED: ascorbate transporter, chloroplastic-like [Priapulus caudatus]|uniref:Ascorbate transporter, chloroplastic-like n=1 Tax=Priapulus caudatus TaxID=37621 RepID=A0ABM1ELD5_PRICU|nr:PREDICTED: ascorbate transporter, chloroplastic-like [Priapulus caudatus]XP_014673006.1 PREDICTED: ascorbate transporter, chloroplastic-like [Priapulus caudatus]